MTETFEARPRWKFVEQSEQFETEDPKILLAYQVAEVAHRAQTRKNKEPYLNHVVAVASIVRDVFGLSDADDVSAALLHDVVEDCGDISSEQLEEISRLVGFEVEKLDLSFINKAFGEEVAFQVDGVTKFGTDKETLKKILLKTLINVRVAVKKLADRLHNMDTLEDMPPVKQIEKSDETMRVYTHLAESLGMWWVKNHLEDKAFRYLEPERFEMVKKQIDEDPRLNSNFINDAIIEWKKWLDVSGLGGVVQVRVKGYHEACKKREKLIEEGRCSHPKDFSEVDDLISFRLVMKNVERANEVLAKLRWEFRNMINGFDDHMTETGDNGYAAYHLKLDFGDGKLVEVAITDEDHEAYNNEGVIYLLRKGFDVSGYIKKMVFSPTNQMHFLPPEATGADYAMAISPELLARAVGMRIDGGEKVDIRTVIPNAADVYIETDESKIAADINWINGCVTPAAKREIVRQQERLVNKQMVELGQKTMEGILSQRGLFNLEDLSKKEFDRVRYILDVDGEMNKVYAKLGAGEYSSEKIKEKLDRAGVVKGGGGEKRTSIRITGPDIKGTMAYITNEIAGFGGSLTFTTNRADGETYEARLVINNLSDGAESELIDSLNDDRENRFVSIEVV